MGVIESRAGRAEERGTLEVRVDANSNGRGGIRYNGAAIRDMQQAATHLKGVLQSCHCSRGVFLLRPSRQTQLRSNTRMVVRDEDTENRDKSFTVRIRPGDNSSCWEYVLFVPQDMSAKTLQQQLIGFIKQQNGGKLPEEQETAMATSRTARSATAVASPPPDSLNVMPTVWPEPKAPPQPVVQKPVAATASVPPDQTPTPTQELETLFGRLSKALARKESREKEIARQGQMIDDLRERIAEAGRAIAAAEAMQLELMAEGERDTEATEAQALLATLKKFSALG